MTEVTKIDGSPGAGKSYQLKQFLKQERQEHGLSLGDFSFITFTNASRDDLVPEVADIVECSDDDAKGAVRTLHSLALSEARHAGIIDDWQTQVISQKSEKGEAENPYREFCERNALEYNAATIKDSHEKGKDGGSGDKLFQISAWLSLTRRDNDEAGLAPVKQPWDTDLLIDLLDKWDAFKRTAYDMPRFEHPDYLDKVIDSHLTPEISVLFIDEFQDLSPQEYLFYKVMRDSDEIERVYIAGDPNQSVYSFRAGTPTYFNKTPADSEVYLSETRRCRGEVADFARKVLNIGPGADTDFNAHRDGGHVSTFDGSVDSRIRFALEAAIDDGGAFLLARTNSKVYSLKSWLMRNGYPFKSLGTRQYSMWNTQSKLDAVNALEALHSGQEVVSRDGLQTLIAHSPAGAMDKDQLENRDVNEYYVDSAWRAFPYADTIGDITDALDFDRHIRRALKAATLRADRPDPDDVHVGTIHAAKGLESPGVLLFNSYNKHLRDSYHADLDTRKEEHRLAYVGATRAEKRLYVVNNYFDGPRMEPLEKARAVGVKA